MREKELRKLLTENINFTAPDFDVEKKKQLSFTKQASFSTKSRLRKLFPYSLASSLTVLLLVFFILISPSLLKRDKIVHDDLDNPKYNPSEDLPDNYYFDGHFNNLDGKYSENEYLRSYVRSVIDDLNLLLKDYGHINEILTKAYSQIPNNQFEFPNYAGKIKYNSNTYLFDFEGIKNFTFITQENDILKIFKFKNNTTYLILIDREATTIFAYYRDNVKVLRFNGNIYEYLEVYGEDSYLYITNDLEDFEGYQYKNVKNYKVEKIKNIDVNQLKEKVLTLKNEANIAP